MRAPQSEEGSRDLNTDERNADEIAGDLADGALDPDEVDDVDPFDEGSDDE